MNLQGLRVVNTRPRDQGLSLSKAIIDAGGIAIDFPTLAIEPIPDTWLATLPPLEDIEQAIFISSNAIHYFFKALAQHQLIWPITIKNYVIGNASAETLEKYGIRVDGIPTIADSEHLLQLNSLQQIKNQTILLIKGEGGRETIAETLNERGANLISIMTYRRILSQINPQFIHSLWHDDKVDIILFTSQQAMLNMFTIVGEEAHDWLCQVPCLVISERIAQVAVTLGIQTIIVSQYDSILPTLERYATNRLCK